MIRFAYLFVVFISTQLCHCDALNKTDWFDNKCLNRKVPKGFTFQSASWVDDETLLILYEDVFLLATMKSNKLLHIYDVVESYTIGNITVSNPGNYRNVYFFNLDDGLFLYTNDKERNEQFFGGNTPVNFTNHEEYISRYYLLNPQNEGLQVFNQVNEPHYINNFTYGLRRLMNNFDSVRTEIYQVYKIDDQNFYFTYIKHRGESDDVFSTNPTGFVYGRNIYFFTDKEEIFALNFSQCKELMSESESFEIAYDLYSFEEFFLCDRKFAFSLENLWQYGLIALIVFLFLLCLCCFAEKKKKKRPLFIKAMRRMPSKVNTKTVSSSEQANSKSIKSQKSVRTRLPDNRNTSLPFTPQDYIKRKKREFSDIE